ncbi:MAG TPA: hypothetical protein VLX28_22535 [Thermoanaerobaculia bacterium]|nr:hypothetical protein [Thermoanaerobaculia bacterium]
MAAPRKLLGLLAGSFLLATVAGCRGTPQPVARAEQTPPAPPPAATTPPPSSPASAPAAPAVKDPSRGDAPVVVDPGVEDGNSPRTLVEAARAERERRAQVGAPAAIVITDKNIHQYAAKGQITVANPKEKDPKKGAIASPVAADTADQPLHDEKYWRSHVLDIRLRWRAAADEIKKLEQQSTELRQRFYSENDSFVRDNRIKPEWDRVTDRLQKARVEAEAASQELAAFLEEGRRANALPGWLREGEDQEPPPVPVKKKNSLPPPQAIDPPVLNDNGGHG